MICCQRFFNSEEGSRASRFSLGTVRRKKRRRKRRRGGGGGGAAKEGGVAGG